jgi:hypothetical protein
LAVMKNSGPVVSSMHTMPINDELITNVLEELWAVVEHSLESLSLQTSYFRTRALDS